MIAARPDAYFDHDADIGIIGQGETLEQAFEAAARAMFGIMADPAGVRTETRVRVSFEEADLELALVTWLNRLLAAAREAGLALGKFALRHEGARWEGEAWGSAWEPGRERGTEVKGATLTMLSVKQVGGNWEVRCVVDV